MSDLNKYIGERKRRTSTSPKSMKTVTISSRSARSSREARESAGLTQEELARRLKPKKTAISRIENHAEDIKLSTLERVAGALGKRLHVSIA